MITIKISKIIRSRRRTIGLQVCPDATLVIRAPFRVSDRYINKLVARKRMWITGKQEIARRQKRAVKEKEFVAGEGFMYLGETYKLQIKKDRSGPLFFDQAFHLAENYQGQARQEFIEWYKKQAYSRITEMVNLYTTRAGSRYRKISITGAKKTWGSCNKDGNLNFSWRLIMAPLPVIDYVVAHEVAHLAHLNHSREFWNKVAVLSPGYKRHKKWLKENGYLLIL